MTEKEIIDKLGLVPLEGEGGQFRQMYVSEEMYDEKHSCGTAIYFLLTDKTYSHLHRLPYDEVWHHYIGDSITIYTIDESGNEKKYVLGKDILNGELPQIVIKKNSWQGAKINCKEGFALLGTTMSPGYCQEDYEIANEEELLDKYPEYTENIKQYVGELKY